jgi:hypothetical protein
VYLSLTRDNESTFPTLIAGSLITKMVLGIAIESVAGSSVQHNYGNSSVLEDLSAGWTSDSTASNRALTLSDVYQSSIERVSNG